MSGLLLPIHTGGTSLGVPHSVLLAAVFVGLVVSMAGGVRVAERLLDRIGR